jgi:hypothetical protein
MRWAPDEGCDTPPHPPADAGTLSHEGRGFAHPPSSCPGLARASTNSFICRVQVVDGRAKPGHDAKGARPGDGDNSAPLHKFLSRQASDPPRFFALLTESGPPTYPHPPILLHPRPTFCPVEASSGGVDDGAEGRFPVVEASPAEAPGRRREHRPFGPFGATAPGVTVARGASPGGREKPAGWATISPDGTGAISPMSRNGRGFHRGRQSPGAAAGEARFKALTGHPVSCPPPRKRGPG